MKKLVTLMILLLLLPACEKEKISDNLNLYITAKIVGFDLNCSTCILEFPDDYLQVSEAAGKSPDNYYVAINMNRGNYEIGQLIKVRVRKPERDEFLPCITLYPSNNYKELYITDCKTFNDLIIGDTVSLSYNDCSYDRENQMYICLDSVMNDSRCPTGAFCFWEGNAEVRFKFAKINEKPVLFNLNTHKSFTTYVVFSGYKITLTGLKPYPGLNHRINQNEYKAEIVIERY
jgi:hypothetical protein